MHVAVFTANQPRHITLLEQLADVCSEITAIFECNTAFPGRIPDLFAASSIMHTYFSRVHEAEKEIFGIPRFLPKNVRPLILKFGDLNFVETGTLERALAADLIILAGASYIRGELCNRMIEKKAINIHMGICPEYRGRHCNFWALYDGHPELVGATIHRVSRGLDTGEILFHAFPKPEAIDPFYLGMKAFNVANIGLIKKLVDGSIFADESITQDTTREIRYSVNEHFNDQVAKHYLEIMPDPGNILSALENRKLSDFIRPIVG